VRTLNEINAVSVLIQKRSYQSTRHVLTCSDQWRRLVQNIGWANQNIGGQKVVKSDKCMDISQLFGARARAAPKSTPMAVMHTMCSDERKCAVMKGYFAVMNTGLERKK